MEGWARREPTTPVHQGRTLPGLMQTPEKRLTRWQSCIRTEGLDPPHQEDGGKGKTRTLAGSTRMKMSGNGMSRRDATTGEEAGRGIALLHAVGPRCRLLGKQAPRTCFGIWQAVAYLQSTAAENASQNAFYDTGKPLGQEH